MKYNLKKINNNKVIFTDGFIGGGKTLIANLISSFKSVEQWNYYSLYEQLCSLNYKKKITLDTASNLILKSYNEKYYDNFILRHANFRKDDISSILNHSRKKQILKRLKFSDNFAEKNVGTTKIINQYMVHMNAPFSEPIFKSFKKDLLYILILRNPLNIYSLHHIAKWTKKWSNKKIRHSMITYYYKNENVPYIISNKLVNEYINCNSYERAIILMNEYYKNIKNIYKFKKRHKSKLIILKFDDFILNPNKYLKKISQILKINIDKVLKKELKKNKIPRRDIYELPKNLKMSSSLYMREYYMNLFPKEFINKNLKQNITISEKEILDYLEKKIKFKYYKQIINLKKKFQEF